MRSCDKARYWQTLRSVANRLVDDQPLPLDIAGVCQALGIRVRFDNLPGKAKAAVVKNGKGAEIRLLQDDSHSPRGAARRRFLIAHELGHIILDRECSAVPMGDSEYWQHEELCDAFAGMLLVPDRLVERIFRDKPETATGLLASVNRLAALAAVPWQTAATRVSQFYRDTALFKAKLVKAKPNQEDRFKIVVSSLPKKREMGRIISCETKLGYVLSKLKAQCRTLPLDSSYFEEPVIPICQGAQTGALGSSGKGEFRLVVRLPPNGQFSETSLSETSSMECQD